MTDRLPPDEVRRLLDDATPGPWWLAERSPDDTVQYDDCDYDRRDWWIDTVLAYFTFALIAFFFGYLRSVTT